MNTLLLFFAFPIATIIIAVILEQCIRCPLKVAALVFAIFLIVTFAAFDVSFLVFAILYTIIAYIAALLTSLIKNMFEEDENENNNGCCRKGRYRCKCVFVPEDNTVALANSLENTLNTNVLNSGNCSTNGTFVLTNNGNNCANHSGNNNGCRCRRR